MSFETVGNKIIIDKPLVDIESAFDLTNKLDKLAEEGVDTIILDMKNAHTLPSVVIGKLSVLKEKGINIQIIIYNDFSYTLFEDLGLTSFFDVKLSS